MSLSLVTAPQGEPITLEEAKAYTHITTQDDDGLLDGLVTAARQAFDGRDAWFGRALLTQTWELTLPAFPPAAPAYAEWSAASSGLAIIMPLPPLQSITSITYVDVNGVTQGLSASAYTVDTKVEPGRVYPVYGTTWPATRGTENSVTIRYVAGYGLAKQVPREIRNWLLQAVGYLYMNREAASLPTNFFWSLAKYRVTWGF